VTLFFKAGIRHYKRLDGQLQRLRLAWRHTRDPAALEWALAATNSFFGLKVLHGLGWRPTGILDVGANRGNWARAAHQLFPQARILMFEAQASMEAGLLTLAAQQPGKFNVHIVLLGPENRDSVEFFQIDAYPATGSSMYQEQTAYPRSVQHLPMRRLDDVVCETRESTFQLLKLDVQGAELDVLKGASKILSGLEVVVMELSIVEYNKGAPSVAEVIRTMEDYGFRLFDVFPFLRSVSGTLLQVNAIFLHDTSRFWATPPFVSRPRFGSDNSRST
jgi:FkbM family methyltransferase